jgi:hypothetical protein
MSRHDDASVRPVKRRGLAYRGICYDVGTAFGPDIGLTRERWDSNLVRGELDAIRDGLHCNAVTVLGSDLDRIVEASEYALRRGLRVVLQPRLFDHPREQILDHLAATARAAEKLRRAHPRLDVTLAVGCEHLLFTPGIVPGHDLYSRVDYITKHPEQLPELNRKLNAFLATEVALVRPLFGGPLTYAAVAGLEDVDWNPFDLVGLDYYDFHTTLAGHRKALEPFRQWDKPIWILEFGCCTFEGAPEMGGEGWSIVDYSVDPPEIPAKYVRSERVQAEYASPYRWARKEAFHAVARFNRQAGR